MMHQHVQNREYTAVFDAFASRKISIYWLKLTKIYTRIMFIGGNIGFVRSSDAPKRALMHPRIMHRDKTEFYCET